MKSQHGYFEVAGRSLYSSLYLPEELRPQWCVVLAEPFGEEKRCAFRMLVRLAKRLADQGVAVLRFDVSGTGDSSGTHDSATWKLWQEEMIQAGQVAKQASGADKLLYMGFRMGAILAAQAAAVSGDALALIEPVLSGKELLEDLERRQKIKNLAVESPEGRRDYAGFVVSDEMAAQLDSAVLIDECNKLPSTMPFQLLRVSGAKSFPATWNMLVTKAQNSPQGEASVLRDRPFWGQVDYFESDIVLDALVQWALKLKG